MCTVVPIALTWIHGFTESIQSYLPRLSVHPSVRDVQVPYSFIGIFLSSFKRLHCDVTNDVTRTLSLADVVCETCDGSLGCLVTANETTVGVIQCGHHYYMFDSHDQCRYNCRRPICSWWCGGFASYIIYSGKSTNDGTPVLLWFSSPEDIHCHIKRLHGVFVSSTRRSNLVGTMTDIQTLSVWCRWHQSQLGHSGNQCVWTNVSWCCQCNLCFICCE